MRKHVKKHTTMATVMAAGALTLGTVLVAGPTSDHTGGDRPHGPEGPRRRRARCTTMIDVRLAELTKLDAAFRAKRITDDHHRHATASKRRGGRRAGRAAHEDGRRHRIGPR